jgi:hypothetical protein
MPDLLEENLEQIAKSLTPKETLEFSLANKEIYQKLLLIIFLELYKQHQEKYSNQHQDSDEEQGIFQFDEDIEKQNEEQEQPLANIFQKIKDKNILAIEELKSQPLMQQIIAIVEERENPNQFLYDRSFSAFSLESKKSQTK